MLEIDKFETSETRCLVMRFLIFVMLTLFYHAITIQISHQVLLHSLYWVKYS